MNMLHRKSNQGPKVQEGTGGGVQQVWCSLVTVEAEQLRWVNNLNAARWLLHKDHVCECAVQHCSPAQILKTRWIFVSKNNQQGQWQTRTATSLSKAPRAI